MSNKHKINLFLMPLLVMLGLLYSYIIHIEISTPIYLKQNKKSFTFDLHSKINQTITLHVGTRDELNAFVCNEDKNRFKYYRGGYDYKQHEEVILNLKRGINGCSMRTKRDASSFPSLKQKISFIDYLVLFILFIVPLFHLLFHGLLVILNTIRRKFIA